MCVTNIAKRRPEAPSLGPQLAAATPSLISQRLLGNFLPLMQNSGTVSTAGVCAPQHQFVQDKNTSSEGHAANGYTLNELGDGKPRPKRRRKPQKPGKTAKQNDRHFVVHCYHDHSEDPAENDEEHGQNRRRGGVANSFPIKLHSVLDQVENDGLSHIVSWQPHGRCFVIHKPKEFVDLIMPKYFRQTKLTSFQRQLNLYGFFRLTRGKDSGGYYHELFLRGKEFLCKRMIRTKVKGTKFKAASSPEHEPDFYSMPTVHATPPTTDESSSDEAGPQSPILNTRPPLQVDASLFSADGFVSTVSLDTVPTLNASSTMHQSASNFALSRRSLVANTSAQSPPLQSSLLGLQPPRPSVTLDPSRFPSISFEPNGGSAMNQASADSVLDEAVEELFRGDPSLQDLSDIDHVWDSSSFGGEDAVRDDTQLGFLLERILED